MGFLDIFLIYIISLIALLFGSYMVSIFLVPLAMFRKIDLKRSPYDMSHVEPPQKIIIVSSIVFSLFWYFILRDFFTDGGYNGIPLLFYIISYIFIWLEITTDQSYEDRPSLKHQMQGNALVITFNLFYEIFTNNIQFY